MSEWALELTRALGEEYGSDKPRICTLATVDKTGLPRARSVVCRRVGPDGAIWLASDARSEKNEHVKANPQAEVVFWLPTRREQFRVQGSVKVLGEPARDPARAELWRELSDEARALFFWPTPGAKKLDTAGAFPKVVDAEKPPPASFEVLILRPRRVEHLQLNPYPHRRRRWMLAGKWTAASEVNP
jgi:pyridoxamine 5'-phosphate oxidase